MTNMLELSSKWAGIVRVNSHPCCYVCPCHDLSEGNGGDALQEQDCHRALVHIYEVLFIVKATPISL